MMADYELKRCPFCGKYPKVDASSGMIPRFIIKCECGATIDSYSTKGRSGAIEAWNSRIYENKLPIMFVEDGSVDIDEVKKLSVNVVIYRQGAPLPQIVKVKE